MYIPTSLKNTALFQSRDTYGEIERIACKIVDLVRDDGYRFKDIALLCGDENDYRHLIEAVFSEYEIPYFTDRTIILSDHLSQCRFYLYSVFLKTIGAMILFSLSSCRFYLQKRTTRKVKIFQVD